MMEMALQIYELLSCRDMARVDFRMDEQSRLYLIEINPLPGLAPQYSDYPMLAEFCGIRHAQLIKKILNSALERYEMPILI